MKTLYLECNMGAAGDMLAAALLELLPDPAGFVEKLNALGLSGVRYFAEPSVKCGISGTHLSVLVNGEEELSLDQGDFELCGRESGAAPVRVQGPEHGPGHRHDQCHDGHHHDHGHHHAGLKDIAAIVDSLGLPEQVRSHALAVYDLVAEAESHAHGKPADQVHFHEVGAMDAIADVVAVCLLLAELGPQQVLASPVQVGGGQVRCAHGIMPVPAPATAFILKGVPIYSGAIRGELCTPTGAALLKHFTGSFGPMPMMKVTAIGYGMGKKDFEAANCVRAFWGETEDSGDMISELSCNLDDMTAESIGYVQNLLLEKGALDVYTTAIGMKKNRPAVMLTCMCRLEQKEAMARLIFRHTSTLGIREYRCQRYTLDKTSRTLKTSLGTVRIKEGRGWGCEKTKPEYEDLARIADETGLSLEEIRNKVGEEARRTGRQD
ncbi:MAG: nickel pincer cofactor biosynthesis protein LarC [Peptococcaceae bacterium]|nr:nickel pincer cofactor biosynthesis protein LarC [Peptococcaceae bacterium]